MLYTISTCILFMAIVAYISWRKTRGTISTASGYFLAGNGLTSLFIGGSLLLSNISTEQLVGQNGSVYAGNMTVLGWELSSPRGIVLLAAFFLPMYLGGAFSTMPSFLKSHYGESVRRLMIGLFMFGYIFVLAPSVLYGGSLALIKVLNLQVMLGLDQITLLWICSISIGTIGAVYAVSGGLKAVAVSDTLNGIGLLLLGLAVPVFALSSLGEKIGGGIIDALYLITTTHTEKLNSIGSDGEMDIIPFSAFFTGVVILSVYYWATNQFIIQRALGAKNLEHGQRGLLFAGFFKFLVPIMAMLPGIIAFHYFGDSLSPADSAYPSIVAVSLPAPLLGVFIAVMLGIVFSTYNSILNSTATMFAIDIYKPFIRPNTSDTHLIKVSKIFGYGCIDHYCRPNVDLCVRGTIYFHPEILWYCCDSGCSTGDLRFICKKTSSFSQSGTDCHCWSYHRLLFSSMGRLRYSH